METTRIKLKDLELNTGQVDGLPRNPRQWSKGDVQRLAKSITETPELLEARPLIAMPHGGKYVVLGGNLRLEALRSLKWAEAPVYLLPGDTPLEKQREIVIKDNGSFGQWDYDALANEWDEPIEEWGVPIWKPEPVYTPAPGTNPQTGAIEGIQNALPEELAGVDLTPDDLPKIEGTDVTAMERVIIVYPKEREKDVAQLLGLEAIAKVVYKVDEIPLLQQ